MPLFRSHGQFPYREVYNIAPENHSAYQSMVYYNKLRYRLMPYIYSMAGMTYLRDYTIMRAMVMDYATDANVNNVSDQYMFGNSIMVCPVYEYGAAERDVYFPNTNGWYDFYSGKYISGGQVMSVDAPYSQIPLFVPEGAIIPFGPDMQYSDEKQAETITLYVYDGKDGAFTLYEDEGTNYNYEKGDYSTIDFVYDNKNKKLTIGNREGAYEGMLHNRIFNIVFVTADKAEVYNPDTPGVRVKYSGEVQEVEFY